MNRIARKMMLLPLASAAVAAVALLVAAPAGAGRPGSALYTQTTPGTYTWTVPNGVKRVTFDVFGAAGGYGGTDRPIVAGGLGGNASATFAVEPGQVFQIVVGGRGADFVDDGTVAQGGFNGGGNGFPNLLVGGGAGGGASDIRAGGCATTSTCDVNGRIVVAGGGGGASGVAAFGGNGGGYVGQAGRTSGNFEAVPGGGGTQTSGGTGCPGCILGSSDGSFGFGGNAGIHGGGGGGGWYGGGGGTDAAGGGGSGYIAPWTLFGTMQAGVQSGNGKVVIYKAS
jgi:hypothetical protein